ALVTADTAKPFPQRFSRNDRKQRVILVPNLSRSFAIIAAAVFRRAGYRAEPLPLADDEAKRLGKRFVHNDMCYPAQINVGEFLRHCAVIRPDPRTIALVLAKNCRDCRAGQYTAVARKALDENGYAGIPIVTTGPDDRGLYPGFKTGLPFSWRMAWAIAMIDAVEAMRLRVRPYERESGSTDRVFDESIAALAEIIEYRPRERLRCLERIVHSFNGLPVDRSERRQRVLVIGEILVNYHETANNRIVRYLEANGLEVILPAMLAFFSREVIVSRSSIGRGLVRMPLVEHAVARAKGVVYEHVRRSIDRVMQNFTYHEPECSMETLASHVDGMVDRTHAAGEGWLIPAEIIEHARHGVRSFVIIQPFGCMPNQVTGKALIGSLKKRLGDVHILAIDYDADASSANVENRLQMLIMASREAPPA
ncbi:MAG: hypothetical protein JW699_00700, partial [Chitinispirillaceae bacterium]|nr:hypothetical protein [Chitinispirillaceae bacterium]